MPLDDQAHRRLLILASLIAAVGLAILFSIPPDRPKTVGGDSGSWLEPARALVEYGAFVRLDDPSVPDYYRPPMTPLFNAVALAIGGESGIRSIVVGQLLLLIGTALMTAAAAEAIRPGTGIVAAALLAFNPNSLSTALLVQSETLFTFFFTASLLGLLLSVRTGSLRQAILCGVGLGLATLTRPTSQYLILLLPIAFVLAGLLDGRRGRLLGGMALRGSVAAVFAVMVVAPWAMTLSAQEGEPTLTTSEIQYRYLWDQIILLHAQVNDLGYSEAGVILETQSHNGRSQRKCITLPPASAERVACFDTLVSVGWERLGAYPLSAWISGLSRATVNYLVSGGAGNWHNLLGVDAGTMTRAWFTADQESAVDSLLGMLRALSGPAALITAFCLIFSVVLKLTGLVGLWSLIRSRDGGAILILTAIPAYFLATALFLAQSRYRLPAEPVFAVLAAIGWASIRCRFALRNARSPGDPGPG